MSVSQRAASLDVEGGTTQRQPKCKLLRDFFCQHLLMILLVTSLLMGIAIGMTLRLRPEKYTTRELLNLRFPGEILMNMLQVLILPLIVSSLISGMTSLDLQSSGKLGLRAVTYYITTTLMAVAVGIILVVIISPGSTGQKPKGTTNKRDVMASDTFVDLVRQLFPNNMIEVAFRKTLTQLVKNPKAVNDSDEPEKIPKLVTKRGINMLGLVMMAVATSVAINYMGEKGELLRSLFNSVTDLTLILIHAVIWYSPIGILFLVIKEIVSLDDPKKVFEQLSLYFLTVMAGLVTHAFLTLPGIFFLICRRNPFSFMRGIMQALLTAIGTSSSLATLPITMRNLEENNHLDPRVVGFVAPVGATINMDGTALYEAVAVIFIAQVEKLGLDLGDMIAICFTATVAAMGAAGTPQAGLVTIVIVLSTVGISSDKIGLILSIDWLLDRFRTSVNVLGDCYGCAIVQQLCKSDLEKMTANARLRAASTASVMHQPIIRVESSRIPTPYPISGSYHRPSSATPGQI